jgi:hypothetical protein
MLLVAARYSAWAIAIARLENYAKGAATQFWGAIMNHIGLLMGKLQLTIIAAKQATCLCL